MTQPTQQPPSTVSAAQLITLIALVEAQAKIRGQLTQAAAKAAVAAFAALTDWWDARKVNAAITAALKVVQPSQRQAARITDAYLARAASAMTGRTTGPAGIVDITRLRRDITEQIARELVDGRREPGYVVLGEHDPDHQRVVAADTIDAPITLAIPDPGETAAERIRRQRAAEAQARAVDPADPYGRVADAYRYQVVANGVSEDRARRGALVRVAAVAQTDVTLAVREQVRKSLGKIRDVRGYRRILRPELSETGPCGLCVVAADRTYKIQDLQPLHDLCVCEVLPIIGDLDPGLELNHRDLQAIYAAAGTTGGGKPGQKFAGKAALKNVRVALAEHGELGPVLVNADQHFRGPRQVAATKVPDVAVRKRAQLDSLDEAYGRLLRRRAAGEDVERPLAWQARTIERLRRELAGAA